RGWRDAAGAEEAWLADARPAHEGTQEARIEARPQSPAVHQALGTYPAAAGVDRPPGVLDEPAPLSPHRFLASRRKASVVHAQDQSLLSPRPTWRSGRSATRPTARLPAGCGADSSASRPRA